MTGQPAGSCIGRENPAAAGHGVVPEKKQRTTSLSVIVPVFNEEYLAEASLHRLKILRESPLLERVRVVVVNDGSMDRTASALDRFQRSVEPDSRMEWLFLCHAENRGKGAAIGTALDYVDTELTVIHDADLEYHPQDLLKMVSVFLEEDADAVFGSRFLAGEYKRVLFFRHALGNHLLTFLCDLVCDLNLTDMETCYKMVRTDLLRSIPLESSDFRFEPELTIKLAKRGARIFEVPIRYSGRTYLEGKKINWKDGVRALLAITRFTVSDRIYTQDQYGSEILERLNRAPRFTKWMADAIRPYLGERVLEIGAGIGNMTLNLLPRSSYWATDVNPLYVKQLQKLCESRPYLHVALTDGSRRESYPHGEQFDTVVCLNVLEHLEDDRAALENIREVLEMGGRAIVLVPQGPRLYGTLDQVLGHVRRYTREQLKALGEQVGLEPEQIIEFNRVGILAWWVNGKLLRRTTFGLGQIKLLNLLTPVFRKLDGWLPLPPLSLIAVLRKAQATPSGPQPHADEFAPAEVSSNAVARR